MLKNLQGANTIRKKYYSVFTSNLLILVAVMELMNFCIITRQ